MKTNGNFEPLHNVLEFYLNQEVEQHLRPDEAMKESKREDIFKVAKNVEDNMIKMPVPDVDFK